MRSSDDVATAQDLYELAFHLDVSRRVRAVARRYVPDNEVDDYCQAVLGALWESILRDLERVGAWQAVSGRCKNLARIWQRQWGKDELEEHSDYRPEWLTGTELLLTEAYLAEVEHVQSGGGVNQKVWWSQRSLALILDCNRSEVEPVQLSTVQWVVSHCEVVLLYRTICDAIAELLAE